MAKMVNLTIDGRTVTVPEGTLIVNAAKKFGIDIPVFCYHPKMEPVGMCRQCLVEVGRPVVDRASGQVVMDGDKVKIGFGPKLETACTTPVAEGMVVLSQSEKARASQKEILEFLLTSHPLDCPVCDKGGECPLQNLTMAHAAPESRFIYDEKHHAEKHVALGDKIWLDRERCIQCARCIRFQDKVAGEAVLAFYQRGRATDIVTYSDPPFDSIFSGNTTDICPVGALTTVDFRFGARPWEMKAAASICPLCPVGCNITFDTRREAKSGGGVVIKRAMPRQNEAVNEIWMCDRGRFGWHFAESKERLARPMTRKDGRLVEAGWEESLRLTAEAFKAAGKESVVLVSGRLANEDLYNLKRLADGLGGQALLYGSLMGGELTCEMGVPAGTNLSDLGPGTTIVVAAGDLYHQAPIWHLRIKQACERGAALVIVNPEATRLDGYARKVVRCKKGAVAEAVLSLVNESENLIAGAENLLVFFGEDGSPDLAKAGAALLKGRQGKVNNGLVGIWPCANDQGAWEMGYRAVGDLAKALKGKTVLMAGVDPAGDDPQLVKAIEGARFVAVQELRLSKSAELAEVVLAAQAFSERSGSFTSGERRAQRFYPAVAVCGESQSDHVIAARLGAALGLDMEEQGAGQVFEQLAAQVAAFGGLTYGKLAEVREQWPLIGRADLYYGGTSYQNSQGLGVQIGLPEKKA